MPQNSTSTEYPQTTSRKMQAKKIDFTETNQFSGIFLDYISNSESLRDFYRSAPSSENIESFIQSKNYDDGQRNTLVKVLREQYQGLSLSENLGLNLDLLEKENTFTITTGHQLNIFSGPLYFMYKIVTAINACKELKEKYPNYNFVPVYWMAGEDHDFEEINHFSLFGKKYQWNSDQKGPVGKFDPAGLQEVLNELPEKIELFEKAYCDFESLCDATRYFVNELFGQEGLVVIDADHKDLKNLFTRVIKDDLQHHQANEIVERDSEKLAGQGYKTQVFPRKINFFYMEKGIRERIVREDDQYKVLNSDLSFSESEIIQLCEEEPEKFSPNVILRPLYQEMILPNLAYIGGPGELAYWLQLKGVFEHYDVAYPMFLPRNHAILINKGSQKKLDKLGMQATDLFETYDQLKESFLKSQDSREVDVSDQKTKISEQFDQLKELAGQIDQSLQGYIAAEEQKSLKAIDNIEKRLKKAEESKSETSLQQIRGLLEKHFPGGTPQERSDNFLNFYINNPSFIQDLLDNFSPFDLRYLILMDE